MDLYQGFYRILFNEESQPEVLHDHITLGKLYLHHNANGNYMRSNPDVINFLDGTCWYLRWFPTWQIYSRSFLSQNVKIQVNMKIGRTRHAHHSLLTVQETVTQFLHLLHNYKAFSDSLPCPIQLVAELDTNLKVLPLAFRCWLYPNPKWRW